jgi:hypothetical protein
MLLGRKSLDDSLGVFFSDVRRLLSGRYRGSKWEGGQMRLSKPK